MRFWNGLNDSLHLLFWSVSQWWIGGYLTLVSFGSFLSRSHPRLRKWDGVEWMHSLVSVDMTLVRNSFVTMWVFKVQPDTFHNENGTIRLFHAFWREIDCFQLETEVISSKYNPTHKQYIFSSFSKLIISHAHLAVPVIKLHSNIY